ncbi:UDP-2,3-diacylglucosamine diphosphatase [Lewinella sp. W8]|uniref:UDP-2,3-diacylglucosamine diphosphatase n=1 Tax=Lewinella sp. W8 TaxID=2528208 RepID=UPI0010674F8D|nr:UDP-2,3-diacylglucosamine diphosphatase [Lewinella sp. W8]MTB53349.1 UDP-2,3-diacylglucosamine diphosphatase [Lewinella sp. W8]
MAVYFASDFHLGVDARQTTREREARIVAWLEHCAHDAEAIYLVGDLFEFWFEWKHVIPRGYVRFLGALARLADRGIELHIFTGNHDMWMEDYFMQELGATLHRSPIRTRLLGHELLIGHGDGLGPGDYGYKRLKKLLAAGWSRWLFARLHPNFAMATALFFSGKSRSSQPPETEFLGPDKEWLVAYSERKLAQDPSLDYLIFGHRHLPIDYRLSNDRSRYVNLGEWLHYDSYARLDERGLELKYWPK